MQDEDDADEIFMTDITDLKREIAIFFDILKDKRTKHRQINDLKTSLNEYKEKFIPPSIQNYTKNQYITS